MIQIPNFTIIETIHRATSVIIYRARRDSDGLQVALKLPPSQLPTPVDIARIQHEHAILRDLDIPGIVKTVGLQPYENGVALILHDIKGRSLTHVLQTRALSLDAVLKIGATVAAALEALHRRSILHKDVTPNNIVIDENEDAFLIDFGLATRLSQEPQRAVRPTALEGTLAYISPEQTGRMNRVADHRSDLYSLGATLYEMLAGEPPFTSDDPTELIHCHIARAAVPLAERVPGLPTVVSDIVAALLAKAPEDRYQTARGLRFDLDECLARLAATGAMEPFPLGRHDISAELVIPQKLYGREAQLTALYAAFERASTGAAELLLVSGYSGVGKSALINEIHQPIARRGGYFVAGKFDQFQRNIPGAPIARALRDLVQQILTEPAARLESWRASLLRALGQSGQLLIDLIPELALIVGPQPPVQELGPSESQNRFALLFQSFIRVFCSPEHPLILFLDDLQWADPASLKMLDLSLTSQDAGHLLIIGAYRDNEVDAAHPLIKAIAQLRKTGDKVSEINLAPLDSIHLTQLLSDTLGQTGAELEALAQVLWEKTHGNPFFLNQLLLQLHRDGILAFDPRVERFRWDLDRVRDMAATGNVVEFMIAKMQRLKPSTQRILQRAACIGHRFDLQSLAIINEKSWQETADELWEALEAGLVLPLSSEYRFVHDAVGKSQGAELAPREFSVSYRFLHDRVQQAAYAMIGEAHSQQIHLTIARIILANGNSEVIEEHLFDIAGHVARGAALVTDPAEKLTFARLNLAAGKKAKAATAYEAASEYFTVGISLLPESSFEDSYDLAFALHVEQSQAEQLSGRLERAERLFGELLQKARTRLHRTQVRGYQVLLFAAQLRLADAVEAARAALAQFDIELPATPEGLQKAVEAQLSVIAVNLAGRKPIDLVDAPLLTDPELRELLALLARVSPAAYLLDGTLLVMVVALQVNLSLKHGNSDWSSYGYVALALVVTHVFNRHEEGRAWGQLALALDRRFNNLDLTARVYEIFAGHVHCVTSPLRDSLGLLDYGYQAAMSAGDFTYLSYVTFMMGFAKFGLGTPLESQEEEVQRHLVLMQRTKEEFSRGIHLVTRQLIKNLAGRTRSHDSLDDNDGFNEAEFVDAFKRDNVLALAGWYYHAKALIFLLREDHERALAMATEGEKCIPGAVGMFFTFDLVFYSCLAMLSVCTGKKEAEREPYREQIEARVAQLRVLSGSCAQNFRHKLLLLEAEVARLAGRSDAVRLYAQAITAARSDGFPHHEALANERCARFFLELDNTSAASLHLTAAHTGYARWGATAKVRQLEEKYASLLIRSVKLTSVASTRQSTASFSLDYLDYTAALRAAQAIAGEIVLSRVVDRLMRIVLADAGAQLGALILARGDELRLNATLSMDPDIVEAGLDVPVEARPDMPRALLNYVARIRRPVVLDDAASDTRFGSDPAIAGRKLRSVLCLPLIHQGLLIGLLFLGSAISDVFTPARIELLELLSTQAAISIENATLYQELDERVKERTRELEEAHRRLIETAHRAGMAEIATRVLHNVGNVLTSVTVSTGLLNEHLRDSRVPLLGRVAGLLRENRAKLGDFLTKDPRGKQLPELLETLASELESERESNLKELGWLQQHVGHIRDIISFQQSFATSAALVESVSVSELMEDALRISGAVPPPEDIEIVREYSDIAGRCMLQKHVVLQILVNLMTNAMQALAEAPEGVQRRLTARLAQEDEQTLRIEVSDTGKGIAPEHMPLIFSFGFTTRAGGHGFGLHSCAVSAKSMQADLRVHSDGAGEGATFTLLLPKDGSIAGEGSGAPGA